MKEIMERIAFVALMPDHHGHACHARRLVKVQTNKSEKEDA
jgi:hypothetical protein